mgnify:CR=1|jgi:hypothetical protein
MKPRDENLAPSLLILLCVCVGATKKGFFPTPSNVSRKGPLVKVNGLFFFWPQKFILALHFLSILRNFQ